IYTWLRVVTNDENESAPTERQGGLTSRLQVRRSVGSPTPSGPFSPRGRSSSASFCLAQHDVKGLRGHLHLFASRRAPLFVAMGRYPTGKLSRPSVFWWGRPC